MSFKYRFILSFVLLEIFFIILIVTVNFVAIKDSSEKLTKEKLDSNITFLEELVKVPLSVYDLASLDNIVENSQKLDYINSFVIVDANNKIISDSFQYQHDSLENILLKKSNSVKEINDETYEVRYEEVFEEEIFLGAIYLIFDLTENKNFIYKNRQNTILIVFVEILISTLASFFIGSRLTSMLTKLSEVAKTIGADKKVDIPYQDKRDEIGLLSKSMNQMQEDLGIRNKKLKDFAIELHHQKNQLLQANQSKDDFLANMSHELKTPLNSINVISSVMMKNKKGKLDTEQVKNLEIINSCGNDLLYLINDVLDISKLEAGEIELNKSTIDFEKTILNIKEMFSPQVEQKNIKFNFSYDSQVKLIYSDEQRIKQIIKNLLSNALKFTLDGEIGLFVSDNNEFIEVIVQDDGIGIAKDKLEHIFDRFKQADESTTRKFGGTGLGLSICKELTTLLEGELYVNSKEGKGTCFHLLLPKKSLSDISKEEQSILNKGDEILLLNSDIVGLMSCVIQLKSKFTIHQTHNVSDFSEALDKSYKLIIADIKKEDYEYIISLLSHKSIPIFFIVENINNLPQKLKDIGSIIIEKPVDTNEFLEKINKYNN